MVRSRSGGHVVGGGGSEHGSGSERDSTNCSWYGSGNDNEYGSARECDNASNSEYSGTQRREVTVVQC